MVYSKLDKEEISTMGLPDFLKSAVKWTQKNQPVHITGAVIHSLHWLFASSTDVVHQNPDFKSPDNETNTLKEGIVIYCIHGTGDRASAFEKVAERLLKQAPHLISSIQRVTFEGRYQGQSIEDFSTQLQEKVIANKHRNVIFMGHSRGGLVASHCALNLNKEITVHGVFTIGSPFKGSVLAKGVLSWFSKSVEQMQPDSDFLTQLTDKIKQSNIPHFYFAAGKDWVVAPDASGVNSQEIEVFERHGHLSLLSSHELIEAIRQRLCKICPFLLEIDTESEWVQVPAERPVGVEADSFVLVEAPKHD